MNKKEDSIVLFIHDHKFITDSLGNFYSEGKITDKVLSRYLALADKVRIISRVQSCDKFDIDKLAKIEGGSFHFHPVWGLSFSRIFGGNLFPNIFLFWRHIKQSRAIVMRMPCFLSIIAFPIILLLKKKYFLEVVGFPKEAAKGKGNSFVYGLVGQFMHFYMRIVVSRASGVVYVSKFSLQNIYPSSQITASISNVELPPVSVDVKTKGYEILGPKPRIGLIWSFSVNYKGVDSAIIVISMLKNSGFECDLHILGTGDMGPYLKLAEDLGCCGNVNFDGIRAGGVEVLDWLDGIDIYVQPSRTEGMPRSLIEAMSRGLPAVASNVGSIPEILDASYLFEPEDIDSFCLILKKLIISQDFRSASGKLNAKVAKEFNSESLDRYRSDFWSSANKLLEMNSKH